MIKSHPYWAYLRGVATVLACVLLAGVALAQELPTRTPAPDFTRPPVIRTTRTLEIPSVGIVSPIKTFPFAPRLGTWRIANYEKQVGHFYGTAWLDEVGNTVLGAHSRYPNKRPALFRDLNKVAIGDEIIVREDNIEYRYVVVNVFVVDYEDISVLTPTEHHRLTLITCDVPSFVPETNSYTGRVVVVADRVGVSE